jgi:uncharacterized protein (TIGR03790 family)
MTDCVWISRFLGIVLVFGCLPIAHTQDRAAAATIVVYNINDPDSAELATYYAARRGIAQGHILGLDCSIKEEISRDDFIRTIADPFRKKMISSGWWRMNPLADHEVVSSSIRFLAIIRGVPLKIAHDSMSRFAPSLGLMHPLMARRNDASVDSELAALGMRDFTPSGTMVNPFFGRFTQILDETGFSGLLLPARLDGPTPSMVRRMIDDSLEVEKEGLWGWAYIDARGITRGSADESYLEGDVWMRRLAFDLRRQGVPTISDDNPETFSSGFPITDAAIYYGWYAGEINGPFANEGFQFKPGAIAVHLHSYSANTLRSETQNWCGPLIARRAAATLGNVYEPYLSFTANFSIFQDRLMTGLTLAESAWMSQRVVSWAGVVIGDPLYRPYSAWNAFYDPRNRPVNNWRSFRSVTRNAKSNILNAIFAINKTAKETRDPMFLEALGSAQLDAGEEAMALNSFRAASKLTQSPAIGTRLSLEIERASRLIPKPTPQVNEENSAQSSPQ